MPNPDPLKSRLLRYLEIDCSYSKHDPTYCAMFESIEKWLAWCKRFGFEEGACREAWDEFQAIKALPELRD